MLKHDARNNSRFASGRWATPGAGAGLLSGVGWVLSYPPVSIWPAALLIVWPAVWLADRKTERPFRDAIWFGLGTVPAWAWQTRWAAMGAPAGYPLLVGYLALFAALTCWAIARLRRVGLPMLLAGPLGWVGVEFFRGRIAFDGFPWFLAAHPLIDAPATAHNPGLAWPAMFVGTYAVSGLLVLVAVVLDRLIRGPRPRRAWAVAAFMLLVWPVGSLVEWTRCDLDAPRPVVGIVQSNVPQSIRGGWAPDDRLTDWKAMRGLLAEAAGQKPRPDVLVIPETMFPGTVLQDDAAAIEREKRIVWRVTGPDGDRVELLTSAIRDDVLHTQETLGIPLLIGAIRHEGFRITEEPDGLLYESDHEYNSVFLVRRGRVEPAAYDKQHLTPFGEIMPYISAWPWLERQLLAFAASGMRFNLDEGRSRTVFTVYPAGGAPIRIVTPVCFEATLPDICRGLVFEGGRRRADLLVNMTNDGWFYHAAGGRGLHELAARWRCVELATPMARAANTGISAVIDRRGVAVASLAPEESGVLVSPVETCGGVTLYARIGDLLGWIFFAGAILGLAASYTPGRRNRTDHPQDDDMNRAASVA